MKKQELKGEIVSGSFPAKVESTLFEGVEVLRIMGSEESIRNTTKILERMYPRAKMACFGEARFWDYQKVDKAGLVKLLPIYELIVMRRV